MNIYNNLLENFKSTYMMMIPLTVILQSCIGSIVALYAMKANSPYFILQMGLCIVVTMIYNASILAQMKPYIVFNLLIVSLVTNISLLFTLA